MDELLQVIDAAPLLEETGIAAVTAAKCFVGWSHDGRVRNEAAFACLAGVSLIPASSENTIRRWLNGSGDRSLSSAFYIAAVVRMTHYEQTRDYIENRRAQDKADKEIRRCIKRYLARCIFRIFAASIKIKDLQAVQYSRTRAYLIIPWARFYNDGQVNPRYRLLTDIQWELIAPYMPDSTSKSSRPFQ